MKLLMLTLMFCLSGCSWFWARKPEAPKPTELIVTGAPDGSLVFLDGVQSVGTPAITGRPQVLSVAPGNHIVEIHREDKVIYREDTDVGAGEHRIVNVLTGSTR